MMIKVAIIEDNDAYRKALQTLVSLTADLELVYSAAIVTGLQKLSALFVLM